MRNISGKQYYPLDEAAVLAGVSVRTLRRWLSDGRLSDFLFHYRTGPNEVLYRLDPPDDGEEPNEKGEYTIKEGGGTDESISSS